MKRSQVEAARREIRAQLEQAGLTVAPELSIEAADFGLGRYAQEGLGLVVRVNEPEYCSKWLTLRPGQQCPRHYHKLKKETFFVLQGEVELEADGQKITLRPGEIFTLRPGVRHAFSSREGAVIEEVSTHDENSDSYFDNPAIVRDPIIEED
ncbi:MAG: D-lyxose/D-mannose family sugar isomerase [Armatimonadetes bacterium]|nr:D-lyxose/D-mannose family sugar isomerase [Armatimonadota bacterium]